MDAALHWHLVGIGCGCCRSYLATVGCLSITGKPGHPQTPGNRHNRQRNQQLKLPGYRIPETKLSCRHRPQTQGKNERGHRTLFRFLQAHQPHTLEECAHYIEQVRGPQPQGEIWVDLHGLLLKS